MDTTRPKGRSRVPDETSLPHLRGDVVLVKHRLERVEVLVNEHEKLLRSNGEPGIAERVRTQGRTLSWLLAVCTALLIQGGVVLFKMMASAP